MGQKINSKSMRLGIVQDWDAKWYGNNKDYSNIFLEDVCLRKYINKNLKHAGISRVLIERVDNRVTITIFTGKPGIIIGRGGSEIEKTREKLNSIVKDQKINLKVIEIKKPESDAKLIADNIASQLEKRISFRYVIKQAVQKAIKSGVSGIKVTVSGRLGGSEIARTEWNSEGKVPLHTIRANIIYGTSEANTTYGKIGVKVWIYLGDILHKKNKKISIKEEIK